MKTRAGTGSRSVQPASYYSSTTVDFSVHELTHCLGMDCHLTGIACVGLPHASFPRDSAHNFVREEVLGLELNRVQSLIRNTRGRGCGSWLKHDVGTRRGIWKCISQFASAVICAVCPFVISRSEQPVRESIVPATVSKALFGSDEPRLGPHLGPARPIRAC